MSIKDKLIALTSQLGDREFNPAETMTVLCHNMNTFFSWGVSQKINLNNKGLALKVSGHHHDGWVLITLSFMDTYSVHIVNNSGEVLESIDDVYFDMLVDIIDKKIEWIDDYVR